MRESHSSNEENLNPNNSKKKEKTENLKIMLWNIEGLKNAMNLTPQDFFHGYDIAILTETFLTENWEHPDFYSTHLKATHGERGRPKGGVSILTRPEHTPIKATRLLEHTILTEIKTCTIIAAYFQPNKTAINIMDEIGQMITQSNQNKPIIIAGDLNCRLDIQTHKSKIIIEKLQEDGFTLLNDPMEPTYFSHNGKSTIDIALIRGTIRGSITPSWTASHAPIRKHIPMEINIKVEWSGTRRKETENLSRVINVRQVEEQANTIREIEMHIQNEDLEKATQAIEDMLRQAAEPKKNRRAEKWFDKE